jgi:hypothetical protein
MGHYYLSGFAGRITGAIRSRNGDGVDAATSLRCPFCPQTYQVITDHFPVGIRIPVTGAVDWLVARHGYGISNS